MSINVVQDLDLGGKSKLIGAIVDPRAAAPTNPADGQIYFDTLTKLFSYYDGLGWVSPGSGSVNTVSGAFPIIVNQTGGSAQVTIAAANGTGAGSMSMAHWILVNGATHNASLNTLVRRDGNGDFTANVITATLTGTASNAALFNGQNSAYFTTRANHTGTQTASTISDLASVVQAYSLSSFAVTTSSLNLNSQRIINLANPTAGTDAATKAYVDASRQALTVKDAAHAASTENVNIAAPGAAIGGVTLAPGNRVLLKDQATASANGIYDWNGAAVPMTRSIDADTSLEVTSGMFVYIDGGTLIGNQYVLSTPNPITLGTTALTFVLFSSASVITAGQGLTKTGTTFAVDADGVTLDFSTNKLEVKNQGVDTTQLKDLGVTAGKLATGAVDLADTKVTGTLPVNRGGTNATTASQARTNLGATTKFTTTIGDNSATTYVVTHNLGTQDIVVLVRENNGLGRQVMAEVQIGSINSINILFASAPANNAYKVTVIG